MALQVAERPVVGDDLEAVAERLEAAARAMAAVAPLADELGQHRRALVRGQVANARRAPRPPSTTAASNSSAASSSSSLPCTDSRRTAGPAASSPRVRSRPEPRRPALGAAAALLEISDPLAAAVGALDARDEARHHGLAARSGSCARSRAPRAAARRTAAAAAARRPGRVAKMPTCESEAAGSSPRSRSSALALIEPRCAASGCAGSRGKRSSAHAITRGSASE